MTTTTQNRYFDRIARVQVYMTENLDQDLDLNHLAEVACFSQTHFHRVYHGMVGETVAQTVRRLRMHRAAGELIRSSSEVETIAKRAGYSTVAAFSRAFKAAYGQAPASYRSQIREMPPFSHGQRETQDMFDVTIKTLSPVKLAAIAHKGDYMEVGAAFEKAFIWAGKNGLMTDQTRSIGIYYDDPSAVATEDLRAEAGLVVDQDYEDQDLGLRTLDVAGGRYAVLRFKGPYAELERAYHWLFGEWLSGSGEEPGEAPCFEEYLNNPRNTPPSELLTDIHLALKS